MAEPARRVDLQLTIPGTPPYDALAGELIGKVAEYVGAAAPAARRVAEDVGALARRLAAAGDIAFTIEGRGDRIIVTAASGTRKEQTVFPL
jgi:hypothetical protein